MNTELAWAAGFFDGEGCIDIWKSKGRKPTWSDHRTFRVQVGQSGDRDTLDRFVKAVGCGTVYGPYSAGGTKAHHKPRFVLIYSSVEMAYAVMNQLWPYLCEPKKRQALMVLDKLEVTK